MAVYESVYSAPVLALDEDGLIVYAATVLGRSTNRINAANGPTFIHVRTWEAGLGERDLDLTPAEFSTWRRSFVRPSVVD